MSTWLFGIARNVVREAIKEKSRQRQTGLGGEGSREFIDTGSRPDEAVIASELRRAIRSALLDLRDDYRLVFILKVFNKMSYEEIAKVTGSSVGKLKTDLRRARLEMRRKLQAYLPESIAGL
jgi:RNA polymerase sigma-70 factor (ECF subfamily)